MLHFQIDPQSGVPIYRQVMDEIRSYAASGVLKPGMQLPSIRDLSKELSVNPTTIVKAYTELEHEGVIEMRQGKGAFLVARDTFFPPSYESQDRLRQMSERLAIEARLKGVSSRDLMNLVWAQIVNLDTMARREAKAQEKPEEPKKPEG